MRTLPSKNVAEKIKMQYIDLHTHSSASDGTDSPAELSVKAARLGLTAFALTDHDTLAGLSAAESSAKDLGMEFIRGCEISANSELGEIHIIGLWLPHGCDELENMLSSLRDAREKRNILMLEKLAVLGFKIDLEEIRHAAGDGVPGRPHIARILMDKGYVADKREAFEKFIGAGCPAYMPKLTLSPELVVGKLSKMGATVVFAHPLLKIVPGAAIDSLTARLKECGLDALEVWHSAHGQKERAYCRKLAEKLELGMSGGSDYHGENKHGIFMGFAGGKTRVPYDILEKLKQRRKKRGQPC